MTIKIFYNVIMPFENTKILEFNEANYRIYQKSNKVLFIIYTDFECIMGKIHGCKNNPENSLTTKLSEDIPSGF